MLEGGLVQCMLAIGSEDRCPTYLLVAAMDPCSPMRQSSAPQNLGLLPLFEILLESGRKPMCPHGIF
jgi:hypothetical protein